MRRFFNNITILIASQILKKYLKIFLFDMQFISTLVQKYTIKLLDLCKILTSAIFMLRFHKMP